MMNLYRFNVTTPDGATLSIVAKDNKQAKDKAWLRLYTGPFLSYGPGNLKVTRRERVDGPPLVDGRLLFPEYLAGG